MLLSCLLVAALETQADVPLRAGRDVPTPKRVHYVEPLYPDIAREAGVAGVVLAEITVKEDGHPQTTLILEPQPLLDKAALDAIGQWRYEPTVVDGRPRRVRLRDLVEVFPDRDSATRYFADLVQNRRQPSAMRVVAAQRLLAGGDSGESVLRALEQAARDKDSQVSRAAADALRGLQEKAAGTAR